LPNLSSVRIDNPSPGISFPCSSAKCQKLPTVEYSQRPTRTQRRNDRPKRACYLLLKLQGIRRTGPTPLNDALGGDLSASLLTCNASRFPDSLERGPCR
jgi:hypothetical protein